MKNKAPVATPPPPRRRPSPLLLLALLLYTASAGAQVQLTLAECEERFRRNSFPLLAAKLNVDVARAQVVQARLWENPYLSAEWNLLNPEDGRLLDAGANGQKAAAVQQLIFLGGKKQKEVALASTYVEIAEWELQDLARNLRYQLRQAYYGIYYNELAAEVLGRQMQQLDTLVTAYAVQAGKGNVPLRDLVRLRSLAVSMRASRNELVMTNLELQQRLSLLMGTDSLVAVKPAPGEVSRYERALARTLPELQQLALANRPDLVVAQKSGTAAAQNLRWQQSLAVPDLTLGASYDQRGGAFNNQVNMTLGVPLVLWNRNQGNIRAARSGKERADLLAEQYQLQVRLEVDLAYRRYLAAQAGQQGIDVHTVSDLEDVYQGMVRNFQRRNVSLIEFTDFMESYHQTLIQVNTLRRVLADACEELNHSTGTNQF